MKVHFYLDDKTAVKTSILLTVRSKYSEKKSLRVGTGISIKTSEWDFKKEQVKRNSTSASELNQLLNTITLKTQELHDSAVRLLKIDPFPYIREELLKSGLLGRVISEEPSKQSTVRECIKIFLKDKSRTNADSTIRTLTTTLRYLDNFITDKTTFDELCTKEFADKVKDYLFTHFANYTIKKHLVIIRRFLNWATKLKYNSNPNHQEYYSEKIKIKVESIALTKNEIDAIEDVDLSLHPGLHNTRILFLIGVYTCMRFSDIVNFNPQKHIKDGVISFVVEKTNETLHIPVIPQLHRIITSETWYSVSNQKANENIKRIAKLAGIDQLTEGGIHKGGERLAISKPRYEYITMHTARRTGITFLLRNGVDRSIVMKVSGHTNSRSFDQYARFVDDDVTKAMLTAWGN